MQVSIWVMSGLFVIVFISFIVTLVNLFKEKMGYNETTMQKLKAHMPESTFFQLEDKVYLARNADAYRRKVMITKIFLGIFTSIMYSMVWIIRGVYGPSGFLSSLFIALTCLLLVYLLFDQATWKEIKRRELAIY